VADNVFSLIDFEKYFHLLADVLPDIKGAGVCDIRGLMFSCSDEWKDPLPGKCLDLSRFLDSGKTDKGKSLSIDCVNEAVSLLRVGLSGRAGETIGSLVIVMGKEPDCSPQHIDGVITDALDAVSACVEREYQLTSELDAMARELAGRYEELNLVYDTRDDVTQYDNEWEALSQLVKNCVEYLDVGMAALLFKGQNKTFCVANKRGPIHEPSAVSKKFYGEFYSWIHSTGQSVVINDFADQQRVRLCPDVPYKVLACPVLDGAGSPVAIIVCANHNDRTDFFNSDRNLLEAMARKAAKIIQANYDSMTGLVKARGLEKTVQELMISVRENGISHCMLHLDIDQLQVINDTLGREAGDAVIKQTAALLQLKVRTTDLVGYLGQGKYGVLLDRCSIDRGVQVAENLRDLIGTKEFLWEGRSTQVTVSAGMAAIESDTTGVEAVLEAAEIACDSAKESGRNRTQVYRQDDGELLARKQQMQLVNGIQTALREDRFSIYCQTIQPTQPGLERYHFEILVRMFDEQGEIVSPGIFIPAAERYHLMPVIDRWVIKKTCETLSQHAMATVAAEGTVSVNLSGQSFADESIIPYISGQLLENGLHPTCLCFEITETAAMSNTEAAHRIIAALKEKGCRFSLDDFGTGMSSFAYLKTLPVDYLKIDGSFVRQIVEDRVSRAMVSSINDIGHVMNLKTIAEFVENDEIGRLLRAMRVDYLQGYNIAKPIPIEDYIASLGDIRSVGVG
jgi:diguanylate cyclase (GGDEF)-like protein